VPTGASGLVWEQVEGTGQTIWGYADGMLAATVVRYGVGRGADFCCNCMSMLCSWFLDGGVTEDPEIFAYIDAADVLGDLLAAGKLDNVPFGGGTTTGDER
jgi:hypothetical protein